MNAYIAGTDSLYCAFIFIQEKRGCVMKLKQRIILGFLMIILVPMLLLAATLYGFSEAQHRSTSKNEAVQEADYDITIGETGVDGSGLRIMTKDLFLRHWSS